MKAKATIIEKSKGLEKCIIEPSCLYTYKLFKDFVILSDNCQIPGGKEVNQEKNNGGYYGTVVASDTPEHPIGSHDYFTIYGIIPFDGEIKLQNN